MGTIYPEAKIEDALVEVLDTYSNANSVTYYKGFDIDEITCPAVIVTCPTSKAEKIGCKITGNHFLDVHVNVVTQTGKQSREDHAEVASDIADVIFRDDFIQLINNSSADVHVMAYEIEDTSRTIDEQHDFTETKIMFYVTASKNV